MMPMVTGGAVVTGTVVVVVVELVVVVVEVVVVDVDVADCCDFTWVSSPPPHATTPSARPAPSAPRPHMPRATRFVIPLPPDAARSARTPPGTTRCARPTSCASSGSYDCCRRRG